MNTLTPEEQKWVIYWTNYKPKENKNHHKSDNSSKGYHYDAQF